MNRIMRLLLVLCLPLASLAQPAGADTCLVCHVNPLAHLQVTKSCCPGTTPASPIIKSKLLERQENYSFHRTLRSIQDPSTLTAFSTFTHNTLGYDKKNFVLDADVQIPISIGGRRFGLNELQIIPRFQVRIFRNDAEVPYGVAGDKSLPVRTPSAMPGVAYYHSFRKWWRNDNSLVKFVGIYAYHHSNGQDGAEFTTVNGRKEVNVYNGNFSEDLVLEPMIGGIKKFAGGMRSGIQMRNDLGDNKPGRQVFVRIDNQQEFYWKLSYEWHPKALANGVFDSLHMTGRNRINLRCGLLVLPTMMEFIGDGEQWCRAVSEKPYERWRFIANFSYILDGKYYRGEDIDNLQKISFLNFNRRLNLSVAAYRIIGHSGNAAGFASVGYYGSDPYNIYFNQSLWQFKIGLAFAFFDQPDEKDNF